MIVAPGVLLDGRYRLHAQVAAGGTSEVWAAVDIGTGQWVAVKVLKESHAGDPVFLERLRAEASFGRRVDHPGVVRVHALVEHVDRPYLVMEYLPGRPLSAWLSAGRRLGVAETINIVTQLAHTLQAAHEAGVIHRDVKPHNVVVNGPVVKLIDFGAARSGNGSGLTQPGMVLGTACYMSPEQALGQRLTAATDLYSLGVVAYECLAGRPPFTGGTPDEIAFSHVQRQPPQLPLEIPAALRQVVYSCLEKDPALRPRSAGELARRLESIRESVIDEVSQAARASASPAGEGVPPGEAQLAGRHQRSAETRAGRHSADHQPARHRRPRAGGGRRARAAARRRRRGVVMSGLGAAAALTAGLMASSQTSVLPFSPYSNNRHEGGSGVAPGASPSSVEATPPQGHPTSARPSRATPRPSRTPSNATPPGSVASTPGRPDAPGQPLPSETPSVAPTSPSPTPSASPSLPSLITPPSSGTAPTDSPTHPATGRSNTATDGRRG